MTYLRTYTAGNPHISLPYVPQYMYVYIFFSLRLYSVVFIAWDSSLSSRRSNDRAGEDVCCTYIVLLAETEEAADLGGTLGAEALGVDDVGQAGDVAVALLDDGQSEDGQVAADDAAADGLTLALTGSAGSVAGVAVGEEESDTGRVHDTLLHGETLLVVSTGDAEDVALELITEVVAGNFLTHLERGQNTSVYLINGAFDCPLIQISPEFYRKTL